MSNFVGTQYCVVFNSGTSALHASLLSIGIKPHEQVIVPTFTFISTVNSVLMVGAVPYFVDIENDTLRLDPNKVLSSISEKVKAINPVHYAGLTCKIDEDPYSQDPYSLYPSWFVIKEKEIKLNLPNKYSKLAMISHKKALEKSKNINVKFIIYSFLKKILSKRIFLLLNKFSTVLLLH